MIVVDASIGVKWFLKEADSDLADEILNSHAGAMAVPELFWIELCAALVRTANTDKTRAAQMQAQIDQLAKLAFGDSISAQALSVATLVTAADIAMAIGHPLKDCTYLALAMELDCPLITADRRFAERARGVYAHVQAL